MTSPSRHIAIVGAGLTGATLIHTLQQLGSTDHITLFDKSWKPGGRLSTRTPRTGGQFDHGAALIHLRDATFTDNHPPHLTPWPENQHTSFVGTPSMRDVVSKQLDTLNIQTHYDTRITDISQEQGRITLHANDTSFGPYDLVVLTPPAPQTAQLIAKIDPTLSVEVGGITMRPQWALLLELDGYGDSFEQVTLDDPLHHIIHDSAKPERPADTTRWVVHASPTWTEEHLEIDAEVMAEVMRDALEDTSWFKTQHWRITNAVAHRWRYARTSHRAPALYFQSTQHPIYLAGDWCGGGDAQGAYFSAKAIAQALMKHE